MNRKTKLNTIRYVEINTQDILRITESQYEKAKNNNTVELRQDILDELELFKKAGTFDINDILEIKKIDKNRIFVKAKLVFDVNQYYSNNGKIAPVSYSAPKSMKSLLLNKRGGKWSK